MIRKSLFFDYKRCPLLFYKNLNKKHHFKDREKSNFKEKISEFFYGNVKILNFTTPSLIPLELKKHKILKNLHVDYKTFQCKIDILETTESGLEMTEIVPKQLLREKVIEAVAYKYYILSLNGITVSKCNVIKICEDYIRDEELDYYSFTEYRDVTKKVMKKLPNVKKIIKHLLADKSYLPVKNTKCFKPASCDYFEECWGEVQEDSVLNLIAMPIDRKLELLKRGIASIKDLNESHMTTFQKLQKESLEKPFIDKKRLQEFLSRFDTELYFLDFESFQPIIPFFQGMKPFEPVVFQYSIHKLSQDSPHAWELWGDT